jgi:HPt (histidine-containing phosphotransfer) domain-containing protein
MGQADVFLSNGFNDFVSKPIDIRQMNVILNKLIRDKQPPEVIEAARNKAVNPFVSVVQASVDSVIIEAFLRDAVKALAKLEAIVKKNGYTDENDMRTYIINVHGIKAALANVGNPELSAVAAKLEKAGRENNIKTITDETPAFLKSLRSFVDGLTPEEENAETEAVEENTELLKEKLLIIRQSCEEYDEIAAEKALYELLGMTWSPEVKELLSGISTFLLHSDFDEILNAVSGYRFD